MYELQPSILKRIASVSIIFGTAFIVIVIFGLSAGSSGLDFFKTVSSLLHKSEDHIYNTIVWNIRFPRVLTASVTGASLSLGGLVFQAILRNPLAEPYILGVSGGAAVGAIIGFIAGLPIFPWVGFISFAGSIAALGLIILIAYSDFFLKKDSLILAGVMINAFCSALVLFLISITEKSKIYNILFWLMGDFSNALMDTRSAVIGTAFILLCFVFIFCFSHSMNLMLMGRNMAMSMGVNIKTVTFSLLIVTSFMVSIIVSQTGLIGFTGLVVPHILRIIIGQDHRVLVPSCILGGGAYMVLCDMIARSLPQNGEMPVGVITAVIGVPIFIILLKKRD